MKIDLEKITFDNINESLKQEIKKDISEFELNLYENKRGGKISVHLYLKDEKSIIINCGELMQFDFPENSSNQSIHNKNINVGYNKAIDIMFNYNNKRYFIQGYV